MNKELNTSMMIGTIFGWAWIFVALNYAPSAPVAIRLIVSSIAILLYGWVVFIRRKSRKSIAESPTSEKSMFRRRSYLLTVVGEVVLILVTVFLLKQANLQIFIPSAIAVVVASHFILLGLFIRVRYLQTIGWIMVTFLIVCNVVFTPTSRLPINHLAVGFGMGLILWISVVISLVRASRVTNHPQI